MEKTWADRIKENGYVNAQTFLPPKTAERLDKIRTARGYKKRSDAVREAIADYIVKHEKQTD